jgi:hypothetical protein
MIAGAAWLPGLELTRIESDPTAAFTLASPLPIEAGGDPVTVKMSVIRCGNQPHDDHSSRIGHWQS